jgi:hypothetical protein
MELSSIALPRCVPNNFPLCTDISIIGFAMSCSYEGHNV